MKPQPHIKFLFVSILLFALASCKKQALNGKVTVNGQVLSASTGVPIPQVKVIMTEQIAGFPFTGSKIINSVTTDNNGQFNMVYSGNSNVSVGISQENPFLSSYVGYEEITWFVSDLPKGENHIVLRPAEFGFINQSFIGDGIYDSVKVKSGHLSFNSNYQPPFYTFQSGDNLAYNGSERIIGYHYYENHYYLNGNVTVEFDTILVQKGQTTTYELHF